MKRFVKIVIPILIAVLALAYPLDVLISNTLKRSNEMQGEFEVMNDIYAGKASCNLAIYGSSRAWVHVSPKIIEDTLGLSVYNFGNDGQSFLLQYLRHKTFFKYNKHPQKIILVVDGFSLTQGDSLYNLRQFLPYMLWNKDVEEYTSVFYGFDKVDYKVPLLRYVGKHEVFGNLVNILLKKDGVQSFRTKGYKGFDWEWNDDFEKAQAQGILTERVIDPAHLKALEEFVTECRTNNIELTLVHAPEYIEGQHHVKNRQEVMDIYIQLAKENQLTFMDYSNSYLCFDKKYFYNASHLNRIGAEAFSAILAHDLKVLYRK